MQTESFQLPWGSEKLPVSLPEGWRLNGVMEPANLPGVADPAQETQRSLQQPVGSARLSELAKVGQKIVLVVDDGSRPTPVACILPVIMEELKLAGVSLEQITLVPALGVHRAMEEQEITARIGSQWLPRLRFANPDCDDPEKLAFLGTTKRGTPVHLNKLVAEADLIISIGCIEPHIIASFGGGYKNLVPGVAGRETIAHNHALNCRPDTFNMVGQPIDKNPMRLDLEEAAGMLKGQVFIVNAVLNSALEVVRVVCGDPIAAHREGTRISASIYGVKLAGPVDIVITNSRPMDQDLRQGVKALANTIRAVRPGGMMITLVRAEEGVGVFGLANRKLPVGKAALKLLAPLLLPLAPKLKLNGMGEEDRFFLYFALQAMRHGSLQLYGPTIPIEIHERLPFVNFINSLEEGLQRACQRFPKKAEVVVFPYGGSTYPILEV
ncbi:MAG: nickel-dependent lactate racemase [Anaerolineaceae bacterium]|nr:nickel-dependent lactate racemase [Anaerolineaceae bacterium]